jgi:hypothetical protein
MKTLSIPGRIMPSTCPAIAEKPMKIVKISSLLSALKYVICALFLLGFTLPVAVGQSDDDFRQENVDEIVNRIQSRLNKSIDSPDWQRDYRVVSANIEDLRKTLAQGGKIKKNPVKKHYQVVADMITERKTDFGAFYNAQIRLLEDRGTKAKRLINDVGLEMISRIVPKPGILTPITQARAKNAKIIKKQFLEIRSVDKAILYLDELMKSLKPSIRELVQRKNALSPLLAQFNSLKEGFDGTYGGKFSGEAGGTIRFTVKGIMVTGSLSGSSQGDPIRGTFRGIVDRFGYMDATLSGTLTDSSSLDLGDFPFKGRITGNLTGAAGKGKWQASNTWAAMKGSWSVTKK